MASLDAKRPKDLRFRLAETEHELVVRIPLVVGFRPIVVQPQTVVVAFQLEDVLVAVGVGVVRCNRSEISITKNFLRP